MSRRALLFGVPGYPETKEFSTLPVAIRDVAALAGVLETTGYQVSAESGAAPLKLTRNALEGALSKAVREADDGEVLFLYFSGHGLNHNGRDYLVPTDVSLDNPNRLEKFLVPVDLTYAAHQSRARLVLFCVDACREGIDWNWKAARKGIGGGTGADLEGPTHFVTLFSCGPEEYSRFDSELSHFTRALTEALSPEASPATLREVIDHAQRRLDEITTHANAPRQVIHWRVEQRAGGGDPLDTIICSGERSQLEEAASSPWGRVAAETPLWTLPADDPMSTRRRAPLKAAINRLVAQTWLAWEAGRTALPEDPWRDEDLAPRTIKRLEQLLFKEGLPITPLRDLEVALLIAAPFLREAVWAAVTAKAAREASPFAPEPLSDDGPLRDALERRYDAQPQWRRKLVRLKGLNRTDDLAAVACWQLYLVIQREAEVWRTEDEGGWLADALPATWQIVGDETPEITEGLTLPRLLELARAVAASGEWLDQRHRHGELHDRVVVGDGAAMTEVREWLLGWLLAFAGHLALDARRLPAVIADHIGLGDPIHPSSVVAQLRRSRWLPKGEGLTFTLPDCDHPALDHALEQYVRGLDELRHRVAMEATEGGPLAPLAALPSHFLSDGVTIAEHDGQPAFARPHMAFELERDQILQLLMGEQLYGDPTLAIRELYQNALDACRYREARERYLRLPGMTKEGKSPWEGKIEFEQGEDENGRPYIECRENGIGMGMAELRDCFTRAGRRFADTPEYLEERVRWQRHGIEHYPNSQFGVGVLSYFMLADELEVETCRLKPQGKPGVRLLATISGSGSLFRVRELGEGEESGTRVRLYLSRVVWKPKYGNEERISVVRVLRELLWVTEFPTRAVEGKEETRWEPGVLEKSGAYPTGHPDIWWVVPDIDEYDNAGRYLADGVVVNKQGDHPFLIINLRGPRKPKLSVDRNKIVSKEKGWAEQVLANPNSSGKPLWHSLLVVPEVTFTWIACITAAHLHLGELIVSELTAKEYRLPAGWPDQYRYRHDKNIKPNTKVSIAEVGVYEDDVKVTQLALEAINKGKFSEEWFNNELSRKAEDIGPLLGHRLAQFSRLGLPVPNQLGKHIDIQICREIKALAPGDGALLKIFLEEDRFDDFSSVKGSRKWCGKENISSLDLAEASWKLKRSLKSISRRIREIAPKSKQIPSIPICMEEHVITSVEAALLALEQRYDTPSLKPSLSRWIATATRFDLQPSKLLKEVAPLSELGITSPVSGEILDSMVDQIDSSLGKEWRTLMFEFVEHPNRPFALLLGNQQTHQRPLALIVSSAQEVFEKLIPYGYKPLEITGNIPADFIASKEDRIVLSRDLDGSQPWITSDLPLGHLHKAATKLNITPAVLAERLRPYTALGLVLPDLGPE